MQIVEASPEFSEPKSGPRRGGVRNSSCVRLVMVYGTGVLPVGEARGSGDAVCTIHRTSHPSPNDKGIVASRRTPIEPLHQPYPQFRTQAG